MPKFNDQTKKMIVTVRESKAWKDSVGAGQKLWGNYLHTLSTSFRNMSRSQQEELITRMSFILAIGGTSLILCLIYPLFPLFIKIIGAPLAIVLAWWFGKNIISKIMIDRFSKYLNDQ
jgi:hypothetical protein